MKEHLEMKILKINKLLNDRHGYSSGGVWSLWLSRGKTPFKFQQPHIRLYLQKFHLDANVLENDAYTACLWQNICGYCDQYGFFFHKFDC